MKAGPAMELHELDLNLLVVFHQLTLERRVSRVAENLGVTQPAISNALAKLRRRFGDELFLRTPRGMEPTPFAEQLAAPVGEALALLHGGLNRRSHFDPPTAQAAAQTTNQMLDVLASQNSDLLQLMSVRAQSDADRDQQTVAKETQSADARRAIATAQDEELKQLRARVYSRKLEAN